MNTFEDNKEQNQSNTFSDVAGNEIKEQSMKAINNKLSQGKHSDSHSNHTGINSLKNNSVQPTSGIKDAGKDATKKIAEEITKKGTEAISSVASSGSAAIPVVGTAVAAMLKTAKAIKGLTNSVEGATQRSSIENDFKGFKGIVIVIVTLILFLCVLVSSLIPVQMTSGWDVIKQVKNAAQNGLDYISSLYNEIFGEEPIYVSSTIEEVETVYKKFIETDYYTGSFIENPEAQMLRFLKDIINAAFTGVTKDYLTEIRKKISETVSINLEYNGLSFSYSKNYNNILSEENFLAQPYPYCLMLDDGSFYTIKDFLDNKIPSAYLNNDLNIVEVISIICLSNAFETTLPENHFPTFDYQKLAEQLCKRYNWQYFFEIEATQVWDDTITVETDNGEIIEISSRAGADKHEAQLYTLFESLLETQKKLEKSEKLAASEVAILNNNLKNIKYKIEELHKAMYGELTFGEDTKNFINCVDCDINGLSEILCPDCLGEKKSNTCAHCGSERFGTIEASICNICNGTGSTTGASQPCSDCNGESVFTKCYKCLNTMREEDYKLNNSFCTNCGHDDTYDYYCPSCNGKGYEIKEGEVCTNCNGSRYTRLPYYGCLDCKGTTFSPCKKCDGSGIIKEICLTCSGTHQIEDIIPAPKPTQYSINRSYHYVFVIKPYGLRELYALMGISPYDYSIKYPFMTNAELLEEMETVTRSLIDSLSFNFGPSSLRPRNTRSLIYDDLLKYNDGIATGRSAMYYIDNNNTSFEQDYTDITYRYDGIKYNVGKNALILDMYAPQYQTESISNISCIFSMIASYFDTREISTESIAVNCMNDTGIFDWTKFEDIYDLKKIISNLHPTESNITGNICSYKAPVLLFVNATREPWVYNETIYANSSHYIVIMGYDTDKIYVYDSASRSNTIDGIPRDAIRLLPKGSNCAVYIKNGGYIGKIKKTQ